MASAQRRAPSGPEGDPGTRQAPSRPESLLLIHPPSWTYVSAASLKIFGDGDWQTRAPGILAVLAVGWLLFFLARSVATAEIAWLALAVYLTNPATLQGALYIGFSEGTLLPLAFVSFAWVWLRMRERPLVRQGITLGIFFPGSLGQDQHFPGFAGVPGVYRSSDACVWVPKGFWPLGSCGAFGRRDFHLHLGGLLLFRRWRASLPCRGSILGSLSIFVVGGQPGDRFCASAFWDGQDDGPAAGGLVCRAVEPFGGLRGMLLRLGICGKREHLEAFDFIYVLTLSVFFAYIVLPGGTGSFPKYHLAVLPFVCFLAIQSIERLFPASSFPGPNPMRWKAAGVVLAAGMFYYAYVVGDFLFLLNHSLRHAVYIGMDPRPVMLHIILKLVLYALFPCAMGLAVQRYLGFSAWKQVLCASCLASQLGLTVAQARGGYFVMHSYGSPIRDYVGLIDILKEGTAPDARILALADVAYSSDRRMIRGMNRALWDQPEALAGLIESERPAAVVYSVATHTIQQMQGLSRCPRLMSDLEGGYRRVPAGEYVVWIRK